MNHNVNLGQFAHVYILTNFDRSVLYIGLTTKLSQRITDHKNGVGSTFTSKYRTFHLVYVEGYDWIWDAIRREKQLKTWNRAWKERLIGEFNPEWKDLSGDVLGF